MAYRAWAVTGTGLWFIPEPETTASGSIVSLAYGKVGASRFIKFRSFSGRTRTLAEIDKPITWGLTVSPDERTVLYSQVDQSGSDLMLVDGFR